VKLRRAQIRNKTDGVLQGAIDDVGGLPAAEAALRAAFYKRHGGNRPTAGQAWRRALRMASLVPAADGRLDYPM
jgi:hypothetical protein